jgi:hypothetical protein
MTLKIVAAGLAALFITASPPAYAEAPTEGQRLSAADLERLTESRINIVKAALQLTPDQEKYWPAVEEAIRNRSKDRQARVAAAAARLNELRDRSVVEVMRDRDPIAFLHRRADALIQRGTDLKKVADAWQPLYQTLTPDQKRRMAALALFVLRDLREAVEHRRLQFEDSDDEE